MSDTLNTLVIRFSRPLWAPMNWIERMIPHGREPWRGPWKLLLNDSNIGRLQIPIPVDRLTNFRIDARTADYQETVGRALRKIFETNSLSSSQYSSFINPNAICELVLESEEGSASPITDVPWEMTYSPSGRRFQPGPKAEIPIGKMNGLSIVRKLICIDDYSAATLDETQPVRVGMVVSNPGDLDVECLKAFSRNIEELVAQLSPLFEYRLLGQLRQLPDLYQVVGDLQEFAPQIIVFVGHGRINRNRTELRFREWEDAATVSKHFAWACPSLLGVVLLSCNTSRTQPTEYPSSNASVATHCFLKSGASFVVGMQGTVRLDFAVNFLQKFLQRSLNYQSLAKAFSSARVEASFPNGETTEWALPALFVSKDLRHLPRLDKLKNIRLAYLSEAADEFPKVPQDYVSRGSADLSVGEQLAIESRGVGSLVAPPGAGASTTLGMSARKQAQSNNEHRRDSYLPRPLLYIDAAAMSSVNHVIAKFVDIARYPPHKCLLRPGASEHTIIAPVLSIDAVMRILRSVDACLVIDHASMLDADAVNAIVTSSEKILTYGGKVCIVLEAEDPSVASRSILAIPSEAEYREMLVGAQLPEEHIAEGYRLTGGSTRLLSALTVSRTGDLRSAVATARDLIGRFQQISPGAVELARRCAVLASGVNKAWVHSFFGEFAKGLGEAIRLGLICEVRRYQSVWLIVPHLYREILFHGGGKGTSKGPGGGGQPFRPRGSFPQPQFESLSSDQVGEIASAIFRQLQYWPVSLSGLRDAPAQSLSFPGILELYRDVIKLFLHSTQFVLPRLGA